MHHILQPLLRVVLIALALALPCSYAWAQQQISVSGTVASEDQQPVPGVTVKVKGAAIGAVTDGNGKFSSAVPPTPYFNSPLSGSLHRKFP